MIYKSEAEYHKATDYTRSSLGGGGMFRSRRPDPVKTYDNLQMLRLPDPAELPDMPYSEVILGKTEGPRGRLDFKTLSRMLACSHIVTASASTGRGKFYFRSVPSAGALYPTELYVSAMGLNGLEDGISHHQIIGWELAALRSGDFSEEWAELTGSSAPALIFPITSVFARSAWKYGNRAFRYCCLDAGHLAEALMLAATAEGLRAEVHVFEDAVAANELLCIDGEREGALCAVSIKVDTEDGGQKEPCPARDKLHDAGGSSGGTTPEILEAYRMSMGPGVSADARISSDDLGLDLIGTDKLPEKPAAVTESFAETVHKRRSERRYADNLSKDETLSMLSMLRGVPDVACRLAVVCGGAEGLADGLHLIDLQGGLLAQAGSVDIRERLAEACLGQGFVARGSLVFVMLSDLEALQERFGAGGYRRALIEAGRQSHRIYLAATSLGLSACGIGAYFDHEVRDILGLAESSRMLYLTVSG